MRNGQYVNRFGQCASFARSPIVLLGQALAISAMLLLSAASARNDLETIRSDVRTPPPPSPSTSSSDRPSSYEGYQDDYYGNGAKSFKDGLFGAGFMVGWFGATSPYWLPRALLADDNDTVYFPRFPYDDTKGYLVSYSWIDELVITRSASAPTADDEQIWVPQEDGPLGDANAPTQDDAVSLTLVFPTNLPTRRWGCQVRADYGDQFADITAVNGQMILESTNRLGVDTSFQYLHERLPGGDSDDLTLGDGLVD